MNQAKNIDARRNAVIEQESRKPGLRGKINAKCAGCIFDPEGGGGNWRQQVTACTSYSCPLYPVRPVSGGQKGQEDAAEDHLINQQRK